MLVRKRRFATENSHAFIKADITIAVRIGTGIYFITGVPNRRTSSIVTAADTESHCDFAPNCLTMPVLETLALTGQQPAAAAAKFAAA